MICGHIFVPGLRAHAHARARYKGSFFLSIYRTYTRTDSFIIVLSSHTQTGMDALDVSHARAFMHVRYRIDSPKCAVVIKDGGDHAAAERSMLPCASVTANKRANNAHHNNGCRATKTLDMEHRYVLERIAKKKAETRALTEKAGALQTEVHARERAGLAQLPPEEVDQYVRDRDALHDVQARIAHVAKEGDEVNYLVATGDILFKYYNVVEHGTADPLARARPHNKRALSCAAPVTVLGGSRHARPGDREQDRPRSEERRAAAACPTTKAKTASSRKKMSAPLGGILSYFQPTEESCGGGEHTAADAPTQQQPASTSAAENGCDAGDLSRRPPQNNETRDRDRHREYENDDGNEDPYEHGAVTSSDEEEDDRATLLDKYMACVNPGYVRKRARHTQEAVELMSKCGHCGSARRVAMMHEGFVYCTDCFTQENILIDHEKPSYKDPPKEIIYYAYKRINHFNEWLNQIQGKETTEIPEEVYDLILLEIRKEKITNMALLNKDKVKSILKKLRINKYYEHVPHIIYRLNGMPVPHMSPQLEERLRHMFCQIQVPFLKHAPPRRKNFLSYAYVLHKLMQLLEQDQYLPSFPLLKSREKLHQQDVVWQKICAELGWAFYKSI